MRIQTNVDRTRNASVRYSVWLIKLTKKPKEEESCKAESSVEDKKRQRESENERQNLEKTPINISYNFVVN